ncbi:unnamed protein product [Ectocarpus fasciculatus]
MQLCVGRSMAMLAILLRNASGFVGPVRFTAARSTGGVLRTMSSSLRMSSGPTATSRPSVPVLDAQAAELKAERLWGMADAQKPGLSVPSERLDVGEVQAAAESKLLQDSASIPGVGALGKGERDDFIEGEGETSALRRYQYSDQLLMDDDSGDESREDDGNEYYI